MNQLNKFVFPASSLFILNNKAKCAYEIGNVQNNEHRFYKKKLVCNGMEIRGSKNVQDKSLIVACERLQHMLRNTSKHVNQNMIDNEVGFNIIAIKEKMTDLPEHSHMKGLEKGYGNKGRSVDECRGMRHGQNVFCGEENLIQQGIKSEYSRNNKSIFFHETAHAIMGDGLDDYARHDINKAYKNAKSDSNIWKKPDGRKAYALSNYKEYFAEMSMWLFNGRGDFADSENKLPTVGAYGIAEHDPYGFKIISNIYNGSKKISRSLNARVVLESLPKVSYNECISRRSEKSKKGSKKVVLSFVLNEEHNDEEYLVSYVNYKGKKTWGFLINKDTVKFNVSTFTGHLWRVEKLEYSPKFYFFGEKVKKPVFIKDYRAENCNIGVCIV